MQYILSEEDMEELKGTGEEDAKKARNELNKWKEKAEEALINLPAQIHRDPHNFEAEETVDRRYSLVKAFLEELSGKKWKDVNIKESINLNLSVIREPF